MKYSDSKLKEIFFVNSPLCDCGSQDCESNHRMCYRCEEKMQWNEYESWTNNIDGSCVWNVDHLIAKSHHGSNASDNLIAVHKKCNEEKADDDFMQNHILL